MNGRELEKIKRLGDAEFRGYLASMIDVLSRDQKELKLDVKEVKSEVVEIKVRLAKVVPHCVQEKRIRALEKSDTARKAINKFLFGAGGAGFMGIIVLILKFVFKLF